MTNKTLIAITYAMAALILFARCNRERNKPTEKQVSELKRRMTNVNRIIVSNYADSISKINSQRQWGLTQSKTGLWYRVHHVGKGDTARVNDVATISYVVSLLNGKVCYTSDSLGLKTFVLGRGGVESGLEQGLLLMRQGDSAIFVMPPHLAYGLLGDQNKIPRMAIVVYDVILQGVDQ